MKNQILHGMLFVASLLCFTVPDINAQYQLTPECFVDIEPNRYIIHFTLPDYTLENEDGNDPESGEEYGEADSCGIFTEIVMGDDVEYDVTDEAGYPELPFFSLNLLLPECVTDVDVSLESSVVEQDFPPYYITPASLGSWVNENGQYMELDSSCYNSEYYFYDRTNEYPNGFYQNFYSVGNVYSTFNSNGITFSIHPFSYHPNQGYMDVLREAVFIVEFDCGNLISTIDDIRGTNDFNSLATQLYFDTFNDFEIDNGRCFNGNYLIVAAHRDMEESLSPYVYYKQLQNFNTEVLYLDEEGCLGNPREIRRLIHFNRLSFYPNYVLLVGNLSDIPPYNGADDADDPYSDDNYSLFLGRWIIGEASDELGNYADLRNIIDKTIQTETDYVTTYSTASLFSGTDSKRRVSKKLYRSIRRIANKSFGPMGIPYTLYDGRNYSTPQAQAYMENAIRNNTRFFIYRGHGYGGGTSSGIASPYAILPSYNFANGSPTPMGFGFACNLNTYNTDYNFGARWVAESTGGGVTFYGATTPSYRSSNNYLSKRMFKTLRKLTRQIDNFPISLWLKIGELNYYNAFSIRLRRIQINKYCLIGDPTLAVYGRNATGNIAPFHTQKRDGMHNMPEQIINQASIVRVEVYDISGNLITTQNNSLPIEELPFLSGVYIIKTTYSDGTSNINKIIK